MFNEIKKSINASLYERLTSPLWGALLTSWLIINWKIIYLTLFVDAEKLPLDKLSMIECNHYSICNFLVKPLALALFLLLIFPLFSNGAYWLNLKYKKWKEDQKKLIENKTSLTIEQSNELRKQLSEGNKEFQILIDAKENKIKELEIEFGELQKEYNSFQGSKQISRDFILQDEWSRQFKNYSEKYPSVIIEMENILTRIDEGWRNYQTSGVDHFDFLKANDIIEDDGEFLRLSSKGEYLKLNLESFKNRAQNKLKEK